jgi:hypothetical protein
MNIFEHGEPIKTTLQDLGSGFLGREMPTTG